MMKLQIKSTIGVFFLSVCTVIVLTFSSCLTNIDSVTLSDAELIALENTVIGPWIATTFNENGINLISSGEINNVIFNFYDNLELDWEITLPDNTFVLFTGSWNIESNGDLSIRFDQSNPFFCDNEIIFFDLFIGSFEDNMELDGFCSDNTSLLIDLELL